MTVTLRDRHHLHLVLLAGLYDRPASGAELVRELARRSGGRLRLGVRTAYAELHHLARNDLVASDGPGRYRLTDAGVRSLRHRERQWQEYATAVDGALAGSREEVRASPTVRRAARSPR